MGHSVYTSSSSSSNQGPGHMPQMHRSLIDLLWYPSNVQTVPPVPPVRILVRVTRETPGSKGWNYYVGEKHGRQFSLNARLPRNILGSFTCRLTWDRRLYFPSEGRRTEDFFALKNPTASAGFEPANLGTKGQHATSRPPKPLCIYYKYFKHNVQRISIQQCTGDK